MDITVTQTWMTAAKLMRHKHIDLAAKHLVARIPKQDLGLGIGKHNDPGLIHHHNRSWDGINDRGEIGNRAYGVSLLFGHFQRNSTIFKNYRHAQCHDRNDWVIAGNKNFTDN